MGCGAVALPLVGGAVIGYEYARLLKEADPKEGTVFGALWMATAMIIAHRSTELQERIDSEHWLVQHAIGITSYVLALLSGVVWLDFLNHVCAFSLSKKLGQHLTMAALLSAKKTYCLYFTLEE